MSGDGSDDLQYGRWLSSPSPGDEVVITGLSGSLPESSNIREFAENLYGKKSMITEDERRWGNEFSEVPKPSGKLININRFDPGFFGLHYQQAYYADAMVRISLEKSVEAVIDAGLNPKELAGSKTGVFVAACMSESEIIWTTNHYSQKLPILTGNTRSMIANRISYYLKLDGPSHNLDTACSSSHFAIECAFNSIRRGNCDQALVICTNLCLEPYITLQFFRLGILNLDGKCKVFDQQADGYTRSESCCAIFVQKSNVAKRIYAQIVHAKTNSDGFKTEGITFPSAEVQGLLLKNLYDECQINAEDLTYLEAHGTGTTVGDPVEMAAIDEVLGKHRKTPLLIGSVKSNLGHPEPSAGLTALFKVILAMENELIPPNINLNCVSDKIKIVLEGRAKLVLEQAELPNQTGLMCINGFGFGGANAHILLRWNPKKKLNHPDSLPRLVCVSARIQDGLDSLLNDIKAHASDHEYLRLFHDIFKYDIDGFYYRGYTIVNQNQEIAKSSKLLTIGKPKSILCFGDLKESWLKILYDLMEISLFADCIKQIDKILIKSGINVLEWLKNKGFKSGKDEIIFGEFVTKLAIANTLNAIDCRFDLYSGNGLDQLICQYINDKTSLDDAVKSFIETVSKPNSFDLEVSNSNKLGSLKQDARSDVIFEIGRVFDGTPDASFRDITSRNGLVLFLEFLGKAYLSGVTSNLAKLYPATEFPVGRGTPSISPLIKWNWSLHFLTPKYRTSDMGVKMSNIDVKTEEWSYLLGHIIDGRNLFPAIGYLYLVWDTFCQRKSITIENSKIIFRNCKFLRATTISTDKRAILIVNIKSHKFEVLEDTTILVSGEIKLHESNLKSNDLDDITTDHDSIVLNSNDVYKELRLRGYNYCNDFKKVKVYDIGRSQGRIIWDGNWVSFIDNMLQMMILEEDTRSLFVPTGIKYLEIDGAKHSAAVKDDPDLVVGINQITKTIRCGGIELRGLKATSIPRRRDNSEPVLERYCFIPNEASLSIEEAIRVNIQLIVENWHDNQFKSLEFMSADLQLLSPIINEALSDLPLLQPEMGVFCEDQEVIPESFVRIKQVPKEGSYVLVITKELFQNSEILDDLVNAVAESAFILTREAPNFILDKPKLGSLQLITMFKIGQETLVLLRKINKNIDAQAIDVSDSTMFKWLPKLQELIKNHGQIIAYSQNEPESGTLGLVNCLRREPNGKEVRAVLIDSASAPQFDLNDSFYLEQLEKGLAINVYKDGTWGTYRHLQLGKNRLIEVKNRFVNISTWGDLKSLTWFESDLKDNLKLPENTELIDVYYTAINFRDVMLASGRINYNVITRNRLLHEKLLGFEYSGLNSKGERVMGILEGGGFATRVECNKNLMWSIPDDWSLEEAATVPCVYSTVLYALLMRGNAKSGESILIHSGTGGVGLAAINISLKYGLEIFTTVGTEEKRRYLRQNFPQIPDDHIGNSRDISFEEMIRVETEGRGVDLVLNSLTEEKLVASVRCLAYGGRLLEIGKFDLANDNDLQLELFADQKSYHGIMLDQIINATDEQGRIIRDLLQNHIDQGYVKPLNRTVFQEDELEDAMRFMMTGKHIGKVLLRLGQQEGRLETKIAKPRYSCDPAKVVIILGGLGGFGLELADWLVLRGARKLVLNSRHGIKTGYQKYRVKIWQSYGCQILISTSDVSSKKGCEEMILEALKLGTIQSIFNLAVVLQDGLFENQEVENFKISLKPKAYATKYLDEITRSQCRDLEDFVVFSSISCGRGNAGQTNYGMANSIMEKICECRLQDGFPALAVQWGAIKDVGLVAEMQIKDETLEIGGTLQQPITNCLQLMDQFLRSGYPIVSSMIVAEKRTASFTIQNLLETVGRALGIKDLKTVSQHSTLSELGMDSMLAVETKQILERELQIILTPQEVRDMTFARLKEIQEQFSSQEETRSSTKINDAPLDIMNFDTIKTSILNNDPDRFETYIKLDTKESGAPVIFFPGIEGDGKVMNNLAKHLTAEAYSLQYCIGKDYSNVEQIADHLLPIIFNLLTEKRFLFVAYSYGCLVALQIVSILEQHGYRGSLYVVDSSQIMMRQISIMYNSVGDVATFLALRMADGFVSKQDLKSNQIIISELATFQDKIELLLTLLTNEFKDHKSYLRDLTVDVFARFLTMGTFDFKFKIKSSVTLAKPRILSFQSIGEDYGLSKICEAGVDVKEFDGNHVTILDQAELAESIQCWIQQ